MRFFRALWRLLVGVKDALVLLLLLLFFGGLYALLSTRPVSSIPATAALTLDLSGAIVDQLSEEAPLTMLSGGGSLTREIRLRDVVRSINAAGADKRIKAIVLDLDGFFGAGQGHLQAIGEALARFRAGGKPIYAYATAYTDDSYYLAAHANEVWLNGLGGVLLTGPGGANLYFKTLLDKLGVDVEVFRVGTYKSFVEPFTLDGPSPEAQQAAQSLADTLWASWRGDVGRARPAAELVPYLDSLPERVSNAGGDLAKAALGAHLVDRIGDRAAFARRMIEIVGQDQQRLPSRWSSVRLADYAQATEPSALAGSAQIGVVYVTGNIVDGEAPPGVAGGETIARLVEEALKSRDLKALVVRVDSPGGSVLASERIRAALMEARRRKLPVIASMGSVAASGGYWVATSAETIYAEPATITGSIGVFGIIPTFQRTLDKIGVNAAGVKTTPYSGEPDVFNGLSPEVKQILQLSVENTYSRFINLVAHARKISPERVDEIAQGRVWAGATARELGLVDHMGTLETAIAEAARRAGLDPTKARVAAVERTPSLPFKLLRDWFGGSDTSETAILAPLAAAGTALFARRGQARMLATLADATEIAGGATLQARCLECGIAARPGAVPAEAMSWTRLIGRILGE